MSLWWASREQLDIDQVRLIEELPLTSSHLVLGPPGSGKTNVLLRRAQFVRSQDMPNVLVLTFTRALTEFLRTGCLDRQEREIFPQNCITTLEAWIRWLFKEHEIEIPDYSDYVKRKKSIALSAQEFVKCGKLPKYDALFVDEAQDLLQEEIDLLSAWSNTLFFVGDSRQQIYDHVAGLDAIRNLHPKPSEHVLQFHYRLAAEICTMADRIMQSTGPDALASTCHYDGPKPATINVIGPRSKTDQIHAMTEKLPSQVRAYGDFLRQGDRIGIVVARRDDRDEVYKALEKITTLAGKSQILRSRSGDEKDREYDPTLDPVRPIIILTIKACKGLEFRALHWLFCDDLQHYNTSEHYYTVVTRAKTGLDLYYSTQLPQALARSYSPTPYQW